MKVRSWNAAQSAASARPSWRVLRREQFAASSRSLLGAPGAENPASPSIRSNRPVLESGFWACALAPLRHAKRQAAQGWSAHGHAGVHRLQTRGTGCALASFTKPLPNPSLERTSTGLALGPRRFSGYRPPRGPNTNPVPAAQLKR